MSRNLTTRPARAPIPVFGFGRDFVDDFEDLIARLTDRGVEGWADGTPPAVDLAETEDSVEVKVDLPGVDPKAIDIRVTGDRLSVSAERCEEKEEKGKSWRRVERRKGSFVRSVRLPCPVEEAKVAASHRNGVLVVTLPKAKEAKPHRVAVKP